MRKRSVVIALVALVAVVIIAGLIVAGNVDHYRPRVEAELQKSLNRPVTMGHLGLKLFPLSIRVDGLTVGESPECSTGRPFATAKEVYAGVSLLSLIRGNPAVGKLVLDKPQIEVARNAAGVWNYSTLGSSRGGASAGPSGTPSASPSPAPSGTPSAGPSGGASGGG